MGKKTLARAVLRPGTRDRCAPPYFGCTHVQALVPGRSHPGLEVGGFSPAMTVPDANWGLKASTARDC